MKNEAIAGYLYVESPYCPACIREQVLPLHLAGSDHRSAEDVLDEAASIRGFQRHDTVSRSSHEFPQPLCADEISDADRCVVCGQRLRTASAEP